MAAFKCETCGAPLEFSEGQTTVKCSFCEVDNTLPKITNEKKAQMYERADHHRRAKDFDKATAIYEQILSEDDSDAETYWSLVLCRFGIEYVEDPATRKYIPTIHRAQFTSIFDDEDYKSALERAVGYQKTIYEEKAQAINEIQKGILAISSKEEPFDVFICYKESDDSGKRTVDSVLANDLYHQLTQEGFKVFFARITLEDKLGSAYEPYIFAALNSAKVMVVLGTKPEYFEAVWVKNEWSRYLTLIKNGEKKMLIPAYKDMDPYNLPIEFSNLQAQDMSKLGFMQDLIRGIKKIVGVDSQNVQNTTKSENSGNTATTESLLKRAYMFLEDGDYTNTSDYCEKVLDIDPENAKAYLCKALADIKLTRMSSIANFDIRKLEYNNNFKKAQRFAQGSFKTELDGYVEESQRCLAIYQKAESLMNNTIEGTSEAAELFRSIPDWHCSKKMLDICIGKINVLKADKNNSYDAGIRKMKNAEHETDPRRKLDAYNSAKGYFSSVFDWKDSKQKHDECIELMKALEPEIAAIEKKEQEEKEERERLEAIKREEARLLAEKKAKKEKTKERIGLFFKILFFPLKLLGKLLILPFLHPVSAVIFVAILLIGGCTGIGKITSTDKAIYKDAVELEEKGEFKEARIRYIHLGDYKDSKEKAEKIFEEHPEALVEGDIVKFGRYEQNNLPDGAETIEWVCIDEHNNIFASVVALDYMPLDWDEGEVWMDEASNLDNWLDNYFFNTAFNEEERDLISEIGMESEGNNERSIDYGRIPVWGPNGDIYVYGNMQDNVKPSVYAMAKSLGYPPENGEEGEKVSFWSNAANNGVYFYNCNIRNTSGETEEKDPEEKHFVRVRIEFADHDSMIEYFKSNPDAEDRTAVEEAPITEEIPAEVTY